MAALKSFAYCWLEPVARVLSLAASESVEAVTVALAFLRACDLMAFSATSWNWRERKPRVAMKRSAKQVG